MQENGVKSKKGKTTAKHTRREDGEAYDNKNKLTYLSNNASVRQTCPVLVALWQLQKSQLLAFFVPPHPLFRFDVICHLMGLRQ